MQTWSSLRKSMRTYVSALLVIALFVTMVQPLTAAPVPIAGNLDPSRPRDAHP